MTKSLVGLLFTALFATSDWHYNLVEARQLARDQHKHIAEFFRKRLVRTMYPVAQTDPG